MSDSPPATPEVANPGGEDNRKRLDIQGLRGVAVLLVVGFHVDRLIDGGFVGVDVFFVISGYVITAMLLREFDRNGRIRLRTFYARRIARLLPALALVTVVVAIASAVLMSPFGQQQLTANLGLGTTFYSANFVAAFEFDYFAPAAELIPFAHTWSLSVEEQFYLIFPVLLVLGWWIGRRVRRSGRSGALILLILAVVASFAVSWVLSYGVLDRLSQEDSRLFAYYLAPARAWEFGVGAAIALGSSVITRFPRFFSDGLAGVGLLAILASGWLIDGSQPFPGLVALLPVLGAACVIAGGLGSATRVPRLLAARPLVWVGDISYSWYLWHWPALVFANVVSPSSTRALLVVAAISLIPAWLSFRFVEDPIRRNRSVNPGRILKIVAVGTIVPTVATTVLLLGSRNHWWSDSVRSIATEVIPQHADEAAGCRDLVPAAGQPGDGCHWNPEAGGPRVYLIGDSNAGQLSEVVIDTAAVLGSPATIATRSACPFIDPAVVATESSNLGGGSLPAFDGPDGDCGRFVTETIAFLGEQPPGVVVIASASDNDIAWSPVAQEVWSQALVGVLEPLRDLGHEVVVVHPIPKLYQADASRALERCPTFLAIRDSAACGLEVGRQASLLHQSPALAAETAAAQTVGVRTLNLFDHLCPTDPCRSDDSSGWIYRDAGHISVAASSRLIPVFSGVFAEALTALTSG